MQRGLFLKKIIHLAFVAEKSIQEKSHLNVNILFYYSFKMKRSRLFTLIVLVDAVHLGRRPTGMDGSNYIMLHHHKAYL